MYYLPLASGYWKTFGKPLDAFWCCTGTGSEEYAKLTDTVYFHNEDSLYVNLYIDSQLEWPEKGLRIKQETRFPEHEGTTLTIAAKAPVEMAVNLRIPYWAQGGSVQINGSPLPAFSSPSSYLSLNRVWKSGDKIELSLPMALHVSPMPDDNKVQAMMYGPLVLAGKFDSVSKEMLYGDYEPKASDQLKVADIVADPNKPTGWVQRDPRQLLTFQTTGQTQNSTLVPLYKIIPERYVVYWNVKDRNS
jgi:DUF1680 family protein